MFYILNRLNVFVEYLFLHADKIALHVIHDNNNNSKFNLIDYLAIRKLFRC